MMRTNTANAFQRINSVKPMPNLTDIIQAAGARRLR